MLHSQVTPPPADFTPPCGFLGLEISTATAEKSGWGYGFVYFISLFTFESSIVISRITLCLYINIYFPH
jgi:hypothetical protein